jgi:hypothetical protein
LFRKYTIQPVGSSPCTRSFPSIWATISCKIRCHENHASDRRR